MCPKTISSSSKENSDFDELTKLYRKNLDLLEEMKEQVFLIRRYLWWARLGGIIKFVIIVMPILLAMVYLPPILRDLMLKLQQLLSSFPPI